jgi:hypothetical protein
LENLQQQNKQKKKKKTNKKNKKQKKDTIGQGVVRDAWNLSHESIGWTSEVH